MVAEDPLEEVLASLDPEQREVAVAPRGPVCVLAGAGTGKTRAIAHRIAYSVRTGAADPAHVLALTFTTRAAGELRERLHRLSGTHHVGLQRVQARTFHSAALRQLRHFWPTVVGGPPPTLVDTKVGLLAEAARALRVSAGAAELRDVATEIEWAKVTQVRPEDYPEAALKAARTPPLPAEVIASLFAGYERLCRERHLVDFESVLELTAAILVENRLAATRVSDRYRYFAVDEYQDVNPLQKLLLDAWLDGRDEVCVVGDPRQTIYSFTGATPAYLTGFPAEFPHATVVRLVRSYRSTPQIVSLANRLTGQPGGRKGKDRTGSADRGPALVSQRTSGPDPEVSEHDDDETEAAAVAERAQQLVAEGVPPREIAVLVRTNAQTERFERSLAQAGVAFRVRGAERFFARREVREAMALLRAAVKSAGQHAGETPAAAVEVRHVLAGAGLSREPPPGRGVARDRWESLAALARLSEDFCAASPGARFRDVVDALAHRAAIEHAPAPEGVTVTSLHAAKGLEWDVVFLPGLTEGSLPVVHAQSDDAVAEERRLLYVGVTRARHRLFLSWALAKSPGGRRTRQPSRFLQDIRLHSSGRAGNPGHPTPAEGTPPLRGQPTVPHPGCGWSQTGPVPCSRTGRGGEREARTDEAGRAV